MPPSALPQQLDLQSTQVLSCPSQQQKHIVPGLQFVPHITACQKWQGTDLFERTAYLVSISVSLCMTASRESHSGAGVSGSAWYGEIVALLGF